MVTKYDINPWIELGARLKRGLSDGSLDEIIVRSTRENPWFTEDSVRMAIQAICSDMLTRTALENWLAPYNDRPQPVRKRVGIVMAGNLPLVGFADLMYVLMAGHDAWIKPSSKDRVLIEYVCNQLQAIEPSYHIEPLDDRIPDAIIATGSDTTRLHFQQRYAGIPALLRGSRHSIAILTGHETPDQLDGLHTDLFAYFGLGCRNVSRLFVPRDYPIETLTDRLQCPPIRHTKYLNAYRQTKATLTLSGRPFLDGGFFLMTEEEVSIQATCLLHYTRYDRPEDLDRWIADHNEQLQCVVADQGEYPRQVAFGQAQHPRPEEYADGVDVMNFLLRLSL